MRYRLWPQVSSFLPLLSLIGPHEATIIHNNGVSQLKEVSKDVMFPLGCFYRIFVTQVID